jgi:hypothetical protein
MFPTSSVVTAITTDRIREAETARRARPIEAEAPQRWRRRRSPRLLVLASFGAASRAR